MTGTLQSFKYVFNIPLVFLCNPIWQPWFMFSFNLYVNVFMAEIIDCGINDIYCVHLP